MAILRHILNKNLNLSRLTMATSWSLNVHCRPIHNRRSSGGAAKNNWMSPTDEHSSKSRQIVKRILSMSRWHSTMSLKLTRDCIASLHATLPVKSPLQSIWTLVVSWIWFFHCSFKTFLKSFQEVNEYEKITKVQWTFFSFFH